MKSEIDLGTNQKDRFAGMEMGPGPNPAGSDRKEYPRLNLSGLKKFGLPDSGTMEIKFRKVSESNSTRGDGSEWHECSLEVQCICEVESAEPKAPAKSDTSAADALDTLAKALQKEKETD